jgi:hypothetical protein
MKTWLLYLKSKWKKQMRRTFRETQNEIVRLRDIEIHSRRLMGAPEGDLCVSYQGESWKQLSWPPVLRVDVYDTKSDVYASLDENGTVTSMKYRGAAVPVAICYNDKPIFTTKNNGTYESDVLSAWNDWTEKLRRKNESREEKTII